LKLFHNNGVLWFSTIRNDAWEQAALQALRAHNLPFESLQPAAFPKLTGTAC